MKKIFYFIIIPIITFFGISNVYAFEYNHALSSNWEVTDNVINNNLYFYSFNSYNRNLPFLEKIINEEYKDKGNYYLFFWHKGSSNNSYFLQTDYTELISFGLNDGLNNSADKGYTKLYIKYDPNKPVYNFNNLITSDTVYNLNTSSFFRIDNVFQSEITHNHTSNDSIFNSNFPEIKLYENDSINFHNYYDNSDYIYYGGDTLFYGSDNGDIFINNPNINNIPEFDLIEKNEVYNDNTYLFTKYELNINNINEDNIIYYYEESYSELKFDKKNYIEDLNLYYINNDYYTSDKFKLIYKKNLVNYLQNSFENNSAIYNLFLNKSTNFIIKINNSNDEYINSESFNIHIDKKIEKQIPYITYEYKSNCKTNHNIYGELITCVNYEINSHIIDNNYNLYVSKNNGNNFEELKTYYPGFYEFNAYENGAYIFIIKDLNENVIDYKTINITSISNESSLIKNNVYIEAKESFEKNEYGYYISNITYRFYNLSETDKVYYSENECPLNVEEKRVFPNNDMLVYSYNKDLYACITVYDENNNYITSLTYTYKVANAQIYLKEESIINKMFNSIKNSSKNGFKLLNYFTNIWEKIISLKIGYYIFLIINTSIVVLIIKSLKR